MKLTRRHLTLAAVAAGAANLFSPAAAQAPGPIRIGSTLALTGPL